MSYKEPVLAEIYTRVGLAEQTLPQEKLIEIVPLLKGCGLTAVEIGQALDQAPPYAQESAQLLSTLPRLRVWDEPRLKLVQLSPDLVVINQKREYLGWDVYSKFVADTLKVIEKVAPPLTYTSVSLRTQDKFTVPSKNFKVGEWLKTDGSIVPRLYENISSPLDIVLGYGYLDLDGKNFSINIVVRRTSSGMEFVFDCGFSRKADQNFDFHKILSELHDEAKATFEGIITDRVRTEVMKGEA